MQIKGSYPFQASVLSASSRKWTTVSVRVPKRIGTECDPLAQPERGRGAEAPTEIARQLVIRRIHIGPCQPAEQLSAVPGLKHAVQNLRIGPQGAGTGIVNRSFHSYNHIVFILLPISEKRDDIIQ